MKKLKIIESIFFALCLLFIGCNELEESPCQQVEITESKTAVVVTDFFSFYPLSYSDSTYISSIDRIILNKKFSNIRPDHASGFSDCEEAEAAAERDFLAGRPALFQVNGAMGNFPLKNEIYSQVLGIHIENTGCYLYGHSDCYNQKTWSLINEYFGNDMRQVLEVLELQYRSLAIDVIRNQAIIVDEMPEIHALGDVAILNSDTIKCSDTSLQLGVFVGKVNRTGKAEILHYLNGSLDCACEAKMRAYFESIKWKPAIIDRDSIDSIVAFQFLN